MKPFLIRFIIIFLYYVVGAYATTDILRLTKNYNDIYDFKNCYCPVCGHKLKLTDQIPLFSYIAHHGKCSYCGAAIPKKEFITELLIFLLSVFFAVALNFDLIAWAINVILYQLIKLFYIFYYGRCRENFVKRLIISLFINGVVFVLIGFTYLIAYFV